MPQSFTAHNDLKTKLIAAQQGDLYSAEFMNELLVSQVFMPVEDEPLDIQDFQRSAKANPPTIEIEDSGKVLVVSIST